MDIQLYLDTSPVSALPEGIAVEIRRRNLVSGQDKARVSFCGMLLMGSEISVFMPRSIKLESFDETERLASASALLRAVELYGRQSKTAINVSDEGEGREGVTKLSLIRELLTSYRQNGLYARRKAVSQLNAGKPDWKATVASGSAFPSRDGRPVYLDIKGSRRRYFSDCEVARIHAYVIRKLDSNYSWLLTVKPSLLAPEPKDVAVPAGTVAYMSSILKRELRLIYSDNDVGLIKALLSFLAEKSGAEEGGSISGLRSFHFGWEHMLSQVLVNKYPINNILPAPSYLQADGGYADAFGSAMKTDIALKHPDKETVAIVDAKYYAAQNVGSAPGWPDLVKQFFYEKALKLVRPTLQVRNAFVFPGEDGPLKSAHLKSREEDKLFDVEFTPISCYYVNPMEVVRSYIHNEKLHRLSECILGE